MFLLKKKIFILGASILQIPAIIKAKEMGFEVAVADKNSKAKGIRYADRFYKISTIDEEGIYKAAKDYQPNGIITTGTDQPIRSIAYASNRLGLTSISYDTAIKCTDKIKMIKVFESNKIPHPWYFEINNVNDIYAIKDKLEYPCISKPIDSSGSRGVTYISAPSDLLRAVEYSLSYGTGVIIEEYLSGIEVSVEIIVNEKEVNIVAITDKTTTGIPNFVEIRHSQPSQLSSEQLKQVKEVAKKSISAIGIDNGAAHVEIMITSEGPKIIELGARMGGDFITTHLVPLSTGVDMLEAVINISCGKKITINRKNKYGAAIQYITGGNGIIKNISGVELARKIKGIKKVELLKRVGDKITKVSNSSDRVGFVIAKANTANEAVEKCKQACSLIDIEIEK